MTESNRTDVLTFTYKNWRGETSVRRATNAVFHFGSTEWHPEPQWIVRAFDVDKGAIRDFALKDMVFGDTPRPQPAHPAKEDRVLVPSHLTAEEGFKYALSGEFWEEIDLPNPEYDEDDEDSEERISVRVPIQWTTIKAIHEAMVRHARKLMPALAQKEPEE